ncbi:LAFE_0B11122g1_1 [Lachancea fermentati]|uniref:Pre-mRNA-splicing factor ISY1 n=1 Tax=Lachancea fermentati TaxID=4955 RepID=A0A1G4M8K7_LACFM|nr:LAFE_0B11122g1_1 [Lachancea fermentati]
MSRNVDKANSVLVRFQELQAEKEGGYKDYSRFKRPTRIYSIRDVEEAQQWRREVLREINNKVTRMHDPSLNEMQLRDLNSELNDLFKEKYRWERHIKQHLKGPDFSKARTSNIAGGTIVDGYRYFGRALDLPEVQQTLKKKADQQAKSRSAKEEQKRLEEKVRVWKNTLNPEYFGYSSDERVRYQRPLEVSMKNVREFLSLKPARLSRLTEYESAASEELKMELGSESVRNSPKLSIPNFESVPNIRDMEAWLVAKKRKKLQEQLGL